MYSSHIPSNPPKRRRENQKCNDKASNTTIGSRSTHIHMNNPLTLSEGGYTVSPYQSKPGLPGCMKAIKTSIRGIRWDHRYRQLLMVLVPVIFRTTAHVYNFANFIFLQKWERKPFVDLQRFIPEKFFSDVWLCMLNKGIRPSGALSVIAGHWSASFGRVPRGHAIPMAMFCLRRHEDICCILQ
ncbi:hypothetical protein BX666DRAFT_1921833 [Dichotomocladium elegans]|nr:hypothetical protein BX666DRAFT_1921833 [Dichotomocladium elegans]